MQRQHKKALYTTVRKDDLKEGWASLELHCTTDGVVGNVARIVFWDAEGQFAIEMTSRELPLHVVEEFINEARATIKIK
jgi:collagenase-like PrtC family protease